MVPARQEITVLEHPLAAVRLTALRSRTTPPVEFRRHLQELSLLLAMEASRRWETQPAEVETPLRTCEGAQLAREVVLVPILRAGLGMLDGISQLLPDAAIGHLGIYRDEMTLRPVTYYSRLPKNISDAEVLLLDPMLATGQSACAGASTLKTEGARSICLVCVVACPPGIEQFQREHPDVPIITAAIDPELNNVGYIVPGLGDAGDRYFATR